MPKPNYVSVRIEAVRTSKACQQAEHDTRSRPPSYLKSDVNAETYVWDLKKSTTMRGDPEALKAKNNRNDTRRANVREMIKQSAREQQERYQSNVKRKPQANSNWFVRGIITFSPEGMPPESATQEVKDVFADQLKQHAKDYIETISKKLNVNPVYMSTHFDETTIHVHFQLENSDKDTGKSISRKIRPSDCRELQDLAGEEFGALGFQRGVSRDVTGAKHKSVRESHRIEQEKLEKQTKEAQEKAVKAKAEKEQLQNRVAQIRRETLPELLTQQNEIRNLEKEKQTLSKELQSAKAELRMMQEEIRDKNKELKYTRDKIDQYSGVIPLAQANDVLRAENASLRQFLREKDLIEEYEDWAADYQAVLREQGEELEDEFAFIR